MKKASFLICGMMLFVLCIANFAQAEEPAILTALGQNCAITVADTATLDAAQGANITQYRVRFMFGDAYTTDARSRIFSNWYQTGEVSTVQTNYTGTWYVSQLSQVIWNNSTSPISQWCTQR